MSSPTQSLRAWGFGHDIVKVLLSSRRTYTSVVSLRNEMLSPSEVLKYIFKSLNCITLESKTLESRI